ncbi:CBS domain-containing protein [Candidatus Bathyarchaeota archaeon]|jgi:CBS domain-containing protein|nr:CBS domain-containing protein [Candidatus Bathyarchaeota archaeon]
MDLEMKIKELIEKDPIIVGPDETLQNVAKQMAKEKRDVVVVMEDEVVKGLVAASDIFHAMRSYVLGKNMLESIPMEIRDVRVSELMRAPQALEFMQACGLTGTNMCIVLGENDKVADAVRTMAISGVDHILIVGDEGVVGTLSDRDLLRAFR